MQKTYQKDLPKYIVYYKECINKETGRYREFFRVEKHPAQKLKLEGIMPDVANTIIHKWATSKSNKIPIMQKLEDAKKYIELLNIYL